ncbi:RICIN domain-containing protein [Kineosporia succinea]|uniref:Ricin B lectin domain-containing protein n=1 Tax=Kineosporia succinea TaxID=84632 RepID=A0ABT9P6T0_9ACTN|nr:RICIN domain-containing protein [Kineosporia succinea]MDP9827765.1 hypothetical protein [Kineosporia succinea]
MHGVAVITGVIAVVGGIALGGVATVSMVAGSDGTPQQNTALTATELGPVTDPTVTAEATTEPVQTSVAPRPKRTQTQEAEAPVPVRTRTVTEKAEPAPSSAPAKVAKQSTAEKDKAVTAAEAVEKKPDTVVRNVGTIKSLVLDNRCIDLPGAEGVAELTTPVSHYCYPGTTDNQEYETVLQSNGTFLLRNAKSKWCFDVPGREVMGSGTQLTMSACNIGDQDNQMFKKQKQGNGFYLINVKSGLCLDISNAGGNDKIDQVLTLYPCSPNDDHVWTFSKS